MRKKLQKILAVLIVIIILFTGLFLFLENPETRLNAEERKWISDNEQIIQNIHVLNDANLFGNLGQGVYYTFLEELTKTYNLKINPVTITTGDRSEELSFSIGDQLPKNAFTFYEDHYVLVGKVEESITNVQNITNKKIGILNRSSNYIKSFMGASTNSYSEYNTMDELLQALDSGNVNYIIIPRMENMNRILAKKYWITYHFSDLKRIFYVVDSNNTTFYNIIKKFYQNWQKENLQKELQTEERNLFLENLGITKASLDELQKKTFYFGYKNHAPYSVKGDTSFGGVISELMKSFEGFAGLDIEYVSYKSDKKLIKDFNNNKIDFFFNFDTKISPGANINTLIPMEFDVYVHESNPLTISTLESLKNYTIYIEEDTSIYQKLLTYEGLKIEPYKEEDLEKILKEKDTLIVMDSLKGKYWKNSILKHHTSRFHYNLNTTYAVRSTGNETLNTLLTKYINYIDNNIIINKGIYSSSNAEAKGSFINSLAKYALYTTILTIIILILIYRSSKRVRMQKKIKKEDKLKLIDQLTSLKNRNYLSETLPNWNKNTIYPQSVIMLDLDKIQEINDTAGYEEGDRQIKGAANILIRSQLENSDIIRTNGNEFVIYLVGYSQKQITSYIHKLSKEFKNLPFDYGVCITYSMILDDLKSVEDAINECVEDIKKQKENKKEEEK